MEKLRVRSAEAGRAVASPSAVGLAHQPSRDPPPLPRLHRLGYVREGYTCQADLHIQFPVPAVEGCVQKNIVQGLSLLVNPVLQVFAKCLGHAFVKDLLARRLAGWWVKWEPLSCPRSLRCSGLMMLVSYWGSHFIHSSWPCLIYAPAPGYLKRFQFPSFCGIQRAACHLWSLLQDDHCNKIALGHKLPSHFQSLVFSLQFPLLSSATWGMNRPCALISLFNQTVHESMDMVAEKNLLNLRDKIHSK